MYSFQDYVKRGLRLINNELFPSRKKLSSVMLYATDRCSAKCKHCNIWAKTPKQHLPLQKIKEIAESPVISPSTVIGLEGGEFILHPEATEILEYLSKKHPCFDLLSNCVQPEKIFNAVSLYPPKRLFVSLDGTPETHNHIRGGELYDKVIRTIEQCRSVVPVSVMFTLTPFNNFKDLEHVAEVCLKYDIDLRVGIYNNMQYFDTTVRSQEADSLDFHVTDIPHVISRFAENYDFVSLYTEYRKGNVLLQCRSIKDSIVIYPNGDVPICQNKHITIGNVFEESLKTVMNKRETRQLHRHHKNNCNECWVNFHRKYDIVYFRSLEKLFPKSLIQLFTGKYHWCSDHKMTYRRFLKSTGKKLS
jgi:MoaA/NifB/PqqE/SkfB family radical SAM enzyme